MKKVLVACLVFLMVPAFFIPGVAQAQPKVTPPPITGADLGLGLGPCYLDGSAPLGITNTKSCLGFAPPPSPGINCNPRGIQNSTLDVEHDVRAQVDIGGAATLYIFYSLGCASAWGAVHVDSGCHTITDIQVTDDHDVSYVEGGLDANGVLRCANNLPWESTFMVPAWSKSNAKVSVTVDLVPQQETVTV